MSEDQLIQFDGGSDLQKFGDEEFSVATKSGDWLPRLQLLTSNSEACKKGDFPTNHYALIDGSGNLDLGETVDILPVVWRPKAMDMNDDILTVHDVKDPEYKRIEETSNKANSNCMHGPEFLVWIPSVEKFATFFMGTKSARRESPSLKSRMGMACTLASKFIETKSYSWFAPQVSPCSAMFEPPPMEDISREAEKFNNPPKVDVEHVDDSEDDRAR